MVLSELAKIEIVFKDVQFIENDHLYKINGEEARSSVTRLLKKYQKPFDSEFFAKKTAARDGVDVSDVLELWDFKKEYACHKGSTFHGYVENFLQRKRITLNRYEIKSFCDSKSWPIDSYYKDIATYLSNFKHFYEWWKEDHVLVKSEFVIADLEKKIGGTIDNLSYNFKTNKLVLFDYKTNKSIETKNKYGTSLIKDLKHLSDCEMVKYSLQMWIYALMLRKVIDFEVDPGCIVWVGGGYQLLPVLDLEAEASLILEKSDLE